MNLLLKPLLIEFFNYSVSLIKKLTGQIFIFLLFMVKEYCYEIKK
ncbi:hypothetical protein PROVRUST_05616 [Providencia rustigianii DSM 4541]|uniref:Uncharacterized protein n=1 Tax=Providencia rustigianii DSM 4541 TaxID=500637 RepID=D1P0A6_9GAMM|nr:hypothetical protein PROVRUST_05616 [Providencia rustigianii DSM 4541]